MVAVDGVEAHAQEPVDLTRMLGVPPQAGQAEAPVEGDQAARPVRFGQVDGVDPGRGEVNRVAFQAVAQAVESGGVHEAYAPVDVTELGQHPGVGVAQPQPVAASGCGHRGDGGRAGVRVLEVERHRDGRVDRVELVYTEFISIGSQKVTTRRFLPLESTETIATEGGGDAGVSGSFEFEPSPEAVLAALLPRYVEARLFGALLESAASEHANRQRAMKAATDNAEELITKLSREMNQARQDAITTEIMEIVGGAEALGSDDDSEEPAPVGAEY